MNSTLNKKLLIFDCDGTLLDTEFIASQVYPKIWAKSGLHYTAAEFAEYFIGKSHGDKHVLEMLSSLPKETLETGEEEFHRQLEVSLQPVAGVRELLETLKQKKLCVASNSSRSYLEKFLASTKLLSFFGENVFSAHECAHPKPLPDVFLKAAKDFGVKASECVVVEDTVTGITAAQRAGMDVIGFMGGAHFGLHPSVKERLLAAGASHYAHSTFELQNILDSKFFWI